jgi:alkaline phosphatase
MTGSLAASLAATCAGSRAKADKNYRARNVILFSADGLSPSAIGMADLAHRYRDGDSLLWTQWLQQSHNVAWVRTEPADWLITDSTASASGWSIGSKVNNNAVSILPDGSMPEPLLYRLSKAGYMTGIATTTSISDASPAAMVSNARSRGDAATILEHYVSRGLNFAIGGGLATWQRHAQHLEPRVTRLNDAGQLRDINPDKQAQFALLADGELECAIDSREGSTRFSALVDSVLDICDRSSSPFCVFIENEQTDTLGHYNDAAGIVQELFEIDAALARLERFVTERDDTLLIVLTDHGNGSPSFVHKSSNAHEHLDRLLGAKQSFVWIRSQFRNSPDQTPKRLASLIHEAQGVRLSDAEVALLARWMNGEQIDPFEKRNRRYSPIASMLGNHFGTAFTADDHTSELIPAIALGPGADLIHGARHHIDIHRVITRALGMSPTT